MVHNAIDPQWGLTGKQPEAAAALRAKLGIGPEKRVLLTVGRLSSEMRGNRRIIVINIPWYMEEG